MSTNLPVLARSLEEGRSIPFLRGERNTTPHRDREHNQTTPIQKPQKEEKRREKTTQSFVQTKQEQEPTRALGGGVGWRSRWPSQGHGRGGARQAFRSPDAEGRQAQSAAAQCQESLRLFPLNSFSLGSTIGCSSS